MARRRQFFTTTKPSSRTCPNRFAATAYHSLLIERSSLPDCLEISAETEEGEIMGVRHKELKVEGVQFHPESILPRTARNCCATSSSRTRNEQDDEEDNAIECSTLGTPGVILKNARFSIPFTLHSPVNRIWNLDSA
jgi:hypothetical protein